MTEIIDNSLQFAATLVCCAVSTALHFKRRSAEYFLLAAFYGFAMGLLYWTLYLVLFETTPGTFYVSEIVWISSCVFLCLLQYTLASPAERGSRRPAMYIAPVSGAVLFAVFFFAGGGDLFSDIMRYCVMSALVWGAVRGLAFEGHRRFHVAMLCFVCAEYSLWLSSITWLGDTLANPYFWIDFALTGILVSLLPAAGKGAGA